MALFKKLKVYTNTIAIWVFAGIQPLVSVNLIAAQNAPAIASTAPPRPEAGDANDRARTLFEAIQKDAPDLASEFFFPKAPFSELKGIANPEQYYDKLNARYVRDIHSLHVQLPELERARFLKFELSRRGGWIKPGEESNRLPYWASRHSFIYYEIDKQIKRIEVRVLITWNNRWYITHLSEFK